MNNPDTQIHPAKIVFVCSGNICRSPAAEALARLWLDRNSKGEVLTESCGTLKITGEPAAPYTIRSMHDRGVDLDNFRSRGLSYFLLRDADLIVCMEQHHRSAVMYELGGDIEFVRCGIPVITEFHPREQYRNDSGIYDFVQAPWDEYSEGIQELEICINMMLEYMFAQVTGE